MAVPTAVAAVPMLLAAGRVPVFRDEVATAQLATLPLGDLWRATGHVDRVVLPYLLLMKGWLGLAGDSTFALRVPSLVAAAGLAAVLAVLAARLAGPVAGAVAGLVVGAAPLVPRLAVLGRPYALAACVALLALLVLHVALDSAARGWWVAYAALVTASLLVQPFAVAAAPAHLALAALAGGRPPWRRLLGAWVLGLGAAALVAVGARGQQGQVGWIPEVDVAGAVEMVRTALSGPVLWLVVAGAVVGLSLVVRGRPAAWWWAGGALVLAPPLLLAVVSAVLQPAFVARYLFLVPSGAALLAGGAAGVVADLLGRPERSGAAATRRAAGVVAAVLLAGSLVVGVALVGRDGGLRLDARQAAAGWSADPESALAQSVGEVLRRGDLLVVEQRVGWGGYAGELARAWGDADLAAALDRRAVSGDLADVARVVTSTGPPRTVAAGGADETGEAGPSGAPVRVVLLSLRSGAAERFVEVAGAGCTAGPRSSDRRLRDTRLWVLECDSAPTATRLSAAPDDPVR